MVTRPSTVRIAAVTVGATVFATLGWVQPAAAQDDVWVVRTAEFSAADSGEDAVTYAPGLVPEDARIAVVESAAADSTKVVVAVHGLEKNRMFGVHVHTGKCGAKGDDAGPHYQDKKDPETPSVDPQYANRKNEVWLDMTTDDGGSGGATAEQQWRFRKGEAQSVILHEHHTSTKDGEAGTAGDRLACFNVPFE
ncbi:superoxide dismutase family protein [Streptomyces sp. A7024]|uniref:Superoxide dismutase family protein n=1 Tax=Streptomyces coryli TaxID=1128680 RepID=A0A6G4U5X2_9ACTN|nr:superoxide dismutase family protein [Streptomyces coryli]NGN67106.1 superoxide dismutase family protein [Streptomyces coryli]